MADHPQMPDPGREMPPRDLVKEIEEWAVSNGLTYSFESASSEFGKVTVFDPNDGRTYTTVPNAHRGRRLRIDQVRYTVRTLNRNWRD